MALQKLDSNKSVSSIGQLRDEQNQSRLEVFPGLVPINFRAPFQNKTQFFLNSFLNRLDKALPNIKIQSKTYLLTDVYLLRDRKLL